MQQPAVRAAADLMEGDVTLQFTSDGSNWLAGFRMRWKAGWS